jgi:hypothetical protein
MEDEVLHRVTECERANRQLRALLGLNLLALPLALLALFGGVAPHRDKPVQGPDSLRLRELVIVDAKGVERVRLGSQLPDAVINGRRSPRGEDAAGVMLYDDSGEERGGYVTFSPSRNVALTLDTRTQQVALLAAGPDDGAVARLSRKDDWVEMRSDVGGTRLSVGRDRKLVLQQPPMTSAEAAAGCAEFKADLRQSKQRSTMQQMDACITRFPGAICRRCLVGK